ncbi:MAG: SPOR domain-containing protein [Ignavibacteriales bacterium]|nr:SPOR domain-containing protein [Ignavibacteriales bacterium]
MLPLQAVQQRPEGDIRNFLHIGLFLGAVLVAGCTSSGYSTFGRSDGEYVTETEPDDTTTAAEEPSEQEETQTTAAPPSTTQRFNVQADTLSAHTRKKTNGGNATISVRAAAPTKYYSVQIGAYRKKINADRNYTVTQKRFKLPMIRLYEGGIKMERICAGRFATKKQAEDFLKKIQEQYPKDYTEAWVCMFKK